MNINLFKTETILKYSKEAHHIAKEKGWWEEKRSIHHIELLIYSELFEAFEAYRNNFIKAGDAVKILLENPDGNIEHFRDFFKRHVKGCFATELADVCIRIFDFIGYQKNTFIDPELSTIMEGRDIPSFFYENFAFSLGKLLKVNSQHMLPRESFTYIYIYTVITALNNGIHLEDYIDLKLKYNKTREYKHGGKKL